MSRTTRGAEGSADKLGSGLAFCLFRTSNQSAYARNRQGGKRQGLTPSMLPQTELRLTCRQAHSPRRRPLIESNCSARLKGKTAFSISKCRNLKRSSRLRRLTVRPLILTGKRQDRVLSLARQTGKPVSALCCTIGRGIAFSLAACRGKGRAPIAGRALR